MDFSGDLNLVYRLNHYSENPKNSIIEYNLSVFIYLGYRFEIFLGFLSSIMF